MKLPNFLQQTKLDNSLLLGFYGGGNYGDELLMEVLAGLLKKQGTKHVSIAYQQPGYYDAYHHDFGYKRVNIHDRKVMLKSIVRAKQLVVGGGGLWGLDSNLNILLMSFMLFISRWLFGKKVYLLEVGYYNSVPKMGRISAWLAGKAANKILARDQETYDNFARINKQTELDTDIAWYIDQLDLTPYQKDLAALEKMIRVKDKTLFITLRRFNGSRRHHLTAVVGEFLRSNQSQPIIIGLLEPRRVDPEGYSLLESWRQTYPNIQIIDFAFNPLALYLFFQKYREKLLFFGPQFHAILSAHLTGVPYMPLAYDNKVENLLRLVAPNHQPMAVQSLKPEDLQNFLAQGKMA